MNSNIKCPRCDEQISVAEVVAMFDQITPQDRSALVAEVEANPDPHVQKWLDNIKSND